MLKKLKDFFKNKEGSALVEAALIMPILVALLLMSFETGRYILAQQKASRVASSMNDLLARVSDPENQFNDIVSAAGLIMSPFNLNEQSIAVSSMIYRDVGDVARIVWQDTGAGSALATSQFGGEGDVASLPDGFSLNEGEVIITTEFYYTYTPLFDYGIWSEHMIYHSAFNKPRLQDLDLLVN